MSEPGGSEFPQTPLRRFIREITDGPFGSSLTSSHYSDDGARVIRLGNIGSAHFKDGDAAFISMEHFKALRHHEVKPGDLLIAGLGDGNHPVGRACVAPSGLGPSIVKADCFRVRLDQSRLTHRYASWALSSSVVSGQVLTLTRGSTRARINLEVAREIQLPVPPVEEQRRITDFLDAETSRIDGLVTRRKVQKKLLMERRAALKTKCVTYSGSGSMYHPLLGNIHSSWPVLPLRRMLPAINVGVVINPSHYFTESGVPFIHGFNVREGFIGSGGMKFMSIESNELHERSRVYAGDVLVVRAGATAGRAAKVGDEFNGANCASVLILRKSKVLDATYLETFINSVAGKGQVSFSQYGAAQEVISAGQVSSFFIALPSVSEQIERVAKLSAATAETVALESGLTRQVALLAERRQALITAAVTGQFDVSTASGRNVTDGVPA